MRAGQIIGVLVLTLFVFGVVMVASAGLRPLARAGAMIEVDPDTGRHQYVDRGSSADRATGTTSEPSRASDLGGRQVLDTLLGREGRMAMMAMLALAIGALVPVERLAALKGLASPAIWLMVFILVLQSLTLVMGVEVHGAVRWLQLGGLQFQPSEVAKWGLPAIVAWHCVRHADEMRRFLTGLLPPLVLVAVVCALIAKEDLGTAVLVMLVCTTMLLVAGARFVHVGALAPIGGLAFVGFVMMEEYRQRRITAFLSPFDEANAGDASYQLIQSMGAIAGGGFGGRGLGNSLQKFDYLPFDHTDFIFAIICEELGFFGAALVIGALVGILWAGMAIVTGRSSPAGSDESLAREAVPAFSRLYGFGILLTFGLQAVINVAVVTGLAPTKGIALPLVSQGGTGWILSAFCLGLVISMDRRAWVVSRRAGLVVDELEEADDLVAEAGVPAFGKG